MRKGGRQVRAIAPNEAKAAKKLVRRVVDLGKEMQADAVDLYYFLLSVRSEFDPDAKDGVTFDNPEELKAFLDEQING